jgi:translation initiation factor 3 subunit I
VGWGVGATRFFTSTDNFMSFVPILSIYGYDPENPTETPESKTQIECGSKVTQAVWGRLDQTIYTCDDQGSVTVYDTETRKVIMHKALHRGPIHKMSFDAEKGMFITSSKDGTAKLIDAKSLEVMKTYQTGRPVNCAVLSPLKNHVLLGGGESAETVTTSKLDTQQFRARFFHSIYENEIGSYMGHFGTMTSIAISPDGKTFASGAEDAYVRLHHLDEEYLSMKD